MESDTVLYQKVSRGYFCQMCLDIFSLPIQTADCCVGTHLSDHHFQFVSSSDHKNHHMISFQVFEIFGTDSTQGHHIQMKYYYIYLL